MIRPFGEAALFLEVDGDDAAGRAGRIAALAAAVSGRPGVIAAIPGLRSLVVRYDPGVTDARQLGDTLRSLGETAASNGQQARERTIPVCYDGDDLREAAAHAGLSSEDFARRHAALTLTVLFTGFAPGFPYAGELPPELAVPRLSTPRRSTPAGSVAVAGRMTGIYPTASPGGWRVIGRTPLRIFDSARQPPAYLAAGDRIRFRAVRSEELPSIDPLPSDW